MMIKGLSEMRTKEIFTEVARELSIRALIEAEDIVGNASRRVNDLRRKLDN